MKKISVPDLVRVRCLTKVRFVIKMVLLKYSSQHTYLCMYVCVYIYIYIYIYIYRTIHVTLPFICPKIGLIYKYDQRLKIFVRTYTFEYNVAYGRNPKWRPCKTPYWQKNMRNHYKFLKHLCFQLVKILIQLFTLRIENYVTQYHPAHLITQLHISKTL